MLGDSRDVTKTAHLVNLGQQNTKGTPIKYVVLGKVCSFDLTVIQ